jgi:hypothetical protein
MLKFVVLSSALARQDIILPVVREINHIKKGMKTYSFRFKSGMCKGVKPLIHQSERKKYRLFLLNFA